MKKIKSDHSITEIDKIIAQVAKSIEDEAGKKIFTLRHFHREGKDKEIEIVIVFEDRAVMHAYITIEKMDEDLGVRVRGNFI